MGIPLITNSKEEGISCIKIQQRNVIKAKLFQHLALRIMRNRFTKAGQRVKYMSRLLVCHKAVQKRDLLHCVTLIPDLSVAWRKCMQTQGEK